MEIKHRYFVQYMLNHGVVPVEKALEYCQAVSEGSVSDMVQLKLLIITINREINKQYFKITLAKCEVTHQELIVWINTKNDSISKLQIAFSPIELQYFHAILQEILNSEEKRITFIVAVNITSTLTQNFSRENGQKVLKKWLNGGYFVKKEEYIYLGARLIIEFTSYLKSHCPDQICKLCSELVFSGNSCGACEKLFHSYCLEKYLTNQNKCPSCQTRWAERTNGINSTQELEYTQERMETNDGDEVVNETASIYSETSEDPNEPGPSRRNTRSKSRRS